MKTTRSWLFAVSLLLLAGPFEAMAGFPLIPGNFTYQGQLT